ncbi:MAG TPA: OmpA family protein [Tepidisphaeraceae bacterium]|nr:OmpA family protein [Tepidisphaeraceae bacterium]
MSIVIRGLLVSAVLSVAGLGCQNKMYTENQDLRQQNLELQQQLDEANRQKMAHATPPPIPAPVQAAAPATPVFEPAPAPVAPAPAPAPRPDFGNLEVTRDTAAGTTTVNLPSDVSFSSGQAVLLPEAKKSLAKVASALKKEYSGKPVRILGNTDSDPIVKSHWKSNQELSEKRADAVRDYLVSKGISSDRITTEGLGDTNPKSKNDKAKNRRVELVVLTR